MLQATFGCSWNRCTFCSFYEDRPFRARSASEFREHCDRVRDLLGRGGTLRRQIFLADGNALILDDDRLRPLLDTVRRGLSRIARSAGSSTCSPASARTPRAGPCCASAASSNVCIGLETGDDALLELAEQAGQRGRGRPRSCAR